MCALKSVLSVIFPFFHPIATEPPFIMAVKEDGLWSKPLNSFGPGEFLSSDIKNVSGKCQVPLHLEWQVSTHSQAIWQIQESSVLVLGQ